MGLESQAQPVSWGVGISRPVLGEGSSHLFPYGARKPGNELYFVLDVLKVSLSSPYSCFSFHSGACPSGGEVSFSYCRDHGQQSSSHPKPPQNSVHACQAAGCLVADLKITLCLFRFYLRFFGERRAIVW